MPGQSWNSAPAFTVTREVASQWRNEGQAVFVNKGSGIQLNTIRLPRSRQLVACSTCGGWSFQRTCGRCRLDEKAFGASKGRFETQ